MRISSEGLQSNEENISWVIISNCFTHESDGQKPDRFLLRSFSLSRKEQISLKISFSKIFPNTCRSETGQYLFTYCLPSFLWTGVTFAFFQVLGQMQKFKEFRNIIDSGLTKDSSHILIILMEISPWQWALFTFKFPIILMIKFSKKGNWINSWVC